MKKKIPTIIIIFALIAGVCLLLYPTISNWWNSFRQTRVISKYIDDVNNLDNNRYNEILREAEVYNEELAQKGLKYMLSDMEIKKYNSMLNFSSTNVMGYIEIPSIQVKLAIYHGTGDDTLAVGVGHVAGSSLPVGGENTHCVLSGHRGLPSATLFSNLDKITEGDRFIINILDKTLTYEVDQIRIVEPHELNDLAIEDGKDYCTLVTCTPYGINTHRLLVRGHRVENVKEQARVTSDAFQIEPVIVAPIVATPMILIFIIFVTIKSHRANKKRKEKNKNEGK
ncbi:MAG: class C sortase [Clostridia bacterium]|nr:class C sortase [Clostridia bacterium]